jgi:hypothetical protein
MIEHSVNVFFYGSYINFKVLKEVDINERAFEVGRVNGYKLTIAPLANLDHKKQGIVYGILTQLMHDELDRLYQEHAKGKLGGEYLPEAVIVYQLNGIYAPALCYISHKMKQATADPAYVDRILKPAQEYGFPKWYLNQIESFK